jgi:anti-sigma regulatory factor (Ser/Thr protein kinase)
MTPDDRFTHDALFFGADDELVRAAVPFLRAGLNNDDEAVLLACSIRNFALLNEAVGDDPDVGFLPHSYVYKRPAVTVAEFQRIVEHQLARGARRIRFIAEVEFGRGPTQWREWNRYEAAVNQTLAPYPLWAVCLYDTQRLPTEVLDAGRCTHPNVCTAGVRRPNPQYLDPAEFLHQSARAAPDPLETTEPDLQADDPTNLARLRSDLHRITLAGSALPEETLSEFVYAVSEVTTNAQQHGRPPVRVRFWATPTRLLCTVSDHGSGFDDPFAGYAIAGERGQFSGAGLCVARQFCDHLDFSAELGLFTVRLASGS